MPQMPTKVEATYVKSQLCRVIHADGAWGGLTPQGTIHMALFSEHTKAPDATVFLLDRATQTAKEQPAGPQTTWIREVEADIILTREAARALRDWLTDKLTKAAEMETNAAVFTTRPTSSEESKP